jgi:hypothetical protein
MQWQDDLMITQLEKLCPDMIREFYLDIHLKGNTI